MKLVFYRVEDFKRSARGPYLYEVRARYGGRPLPEAAVTLRVYSLDGDGRVVVYEEKRHVGWRDVEKEGAGNYLDGLSKAVERAAGELEELAKKEFPGAVPGRLEG